MKNAAAGEDRSGPAAGQPMGPGFAKNPKREHPPPKTCHFDRRDGALCRPGAEKSLLDFAFQAKNPSSGESDPLRTRGS